MAIELTGIEAKITHKKDGWKTTLHLSKRGDKYYWLAPDYRITNVDHPHLDYWESRDAAIEGLPDIFREHYIHFAFVLSSSEEN